MEKINEPLLGGTDPKRQHPFLNSILLGIAIFLILSLEVPNTYFLTNVESFFVYFLAVVAILLSSLLITELREKISILISILIFLIVFIINVNIYSLSIFSIIIQPFGTNLLSIAVGTYIMTISDRSNIGRNFGLFFGSTAFLEGLFLVSTANFIYVSQFVYIFFMILAVFLILLLKNPCCEQNENIAVTGNDTQSFLNAIAYPMSILADKEFLFLVPGIVFLGLVQLLFPVALLETTISFFEFTQNFSGSMYFLGAVISILFGFLFDRIEKRYLLFAVAGVGIIGAALNIAYAHTTCCSQGQVNLVYASYIFNTICQYGLKVFIYSLLGLLYLDCRSLSVNVCCQLIITAGYLFIYIFFFFINITASFYIFFIVFILACLGIFKFLSSNDKEIV
ncbi:hypothetical protein ACTFIV_009781 [Dictyostelium citrinum]